MNERSSPSDGSPFDSLDRCFQSRGTYRVNFDRDETDSFSLDVQRLPRSSEGPTLPKEDVLPLLPSGSQWSRACGWRSVNGIPFRSGGSLWLALGLTRVLEHETRGAYPVCRYYVLPFEKTPIIKGLAEFIEALAPEESGDDEDIRPAYGAIMGSASDPTEHRETEYWILRHAKAAYERGRQLLFRTAVMSVEDVPALSLFSLFRGGFTGGDSPIDYQRCLYSTIPVTYESFGWASKFKVMLELDLSTDVLSG